MSKIKISNEILNYFSKQTNIPLNKINLYKNEFDSKYSRDYYNFEYYLKNTYYWSKNSNSLIWEIVYSKINKNSKNLLDFGCGIGLFTSKLKSITKNYIGTDISDTALNLAKIIHKNKSNLSFLSLSEFDNLYQKFDVIFSSETIDHIVEPKIILDKLKNKLTTDGILILSVTTIYHYLFRILLVYLPKDIQDGKFLKSIHRIYLFFFSLFFENKRQIFLEQGLDRYDHKNAFTLSQIKRIAKDIGMKVDYFEYFNCKDIFPYKNLEFINKFLKVKLRRSNIYGPNLVIFLRKV